MPTPLLGAAFSARPPRSLLLCLVLLATLTLAPGSCAQTLNNPRVNPTPRTGLVNPNGPPGVATNQAGFYTSGSSIIGASWGTADAQAVTIYGPSGWESWQDQQTWVDALGQVHSGAYPAIPRYVDWIDQNDFFWEVNISLQTRL